MASRRLGLGRVVVLAAVMSVVVGAWIERAAAQGFLVTETAYQPLVAGTRYGLNNEGDIFDFRGSATGVYYTDMGQTFEVPNTSTPEFSLRSGINDGGHAAGIARDQMGQFVFLWRKGSVTATGRPVRPDSQVGTTQNVFVANGPFVAGTGTAGAWRWNGTDFVWLRTPGSTVPAWNSTATGINNQGRVCGYSQLLSVFRPAVWTNEFGEFLPMPGGYQDVRPTGINDSGEVIGVATNVVGSIGIRWTPNGQIFSLGAFANPIDINNSGEIIGTRVEGGVTRHLLWRNGVSVRIANLVVNTDYQVTSALAINDMGQILAFAFKVSEGRTRMVILTPTDESPGMGPPPPSAVTPAFSKRFSGTFEGGTLWTNANNTRNRAMHFDVSGASPFAVVRLYADDILIGEQRGAFGRFRFRTNGRTMLNDGSYVLSAAQFGAGVESERMAFMTLVVDTVAPTTPDAPDLAPESDTGPSDSDNITGTRTLKFTGTGPPGLTVQMRIKKKTLRNPTVTIAQDGTWSLTIPNAPKGRAPYAAVYTDPAGNVSPPGVPLEVTVLAGKVKKASKLKMEPGDVYAPASTKKVPGTLNVRPSFTGRGQRDSIARLFVDGLPSGTAGANPNGTWLVTVNRDLAVGEHQLVVVLENGAGIVSQPSKPLRFIVVAAPASAAGLGMPQSIGWLIDDAAEPDVNGDGVVDMRDLRAVTSWVGDDDAPDEMDVNGDGVVDSEDVRLVLEAMERGG